ncbi:MAG: Ig family protein [Acidobacteriales bacterium]|nr:Ig family protein [Terriglobales bacterium]
MSGVRWVGFLLFLVLNSLPITAFAGQNKLLMAAPSAINFAPTYVGSKTSTVVTLINNGTMSLKITGVVVSGAGFSVTGLALPFSLPAGKSANFSADFNPTTPGTSSGAISISSNSAGSPAIISLQGNSITPPQITTASVPSGQVGASYSATLNATGGVQPYQWTLVSSALPSGLSLDSTSGSISGIPQIPGTTNLAFQLADSSAPPHTDTKSFSLTIASPALQISTASLPDANLGNAYSTALAGSGGQSPYTWSAGSGLPSGITLHSDGTLSGTSAQSGTFSFNATLGDSQGATVTKGLVLNVINTLPVGQIPLTQCGVLSATGSTYVLQTDVSSPGTCFSVQADKITLDLNGHTVTYATADSGGQHRHAVLGIACWDYDLQGNPCGGSSATFTLMNGKIVQGLLAAPFSHAVRIGQTNNLSNLTVHHVEITVAAPNSIPIYTNFSNGGANIYSNVLHNNVTAINNRGAFQGMSIKLDNEIAATQPNSIHDNVIIGGAQGGIRETNASGTKIFNNDISMNATYSNDFCIDAPGSNIEIYSNNCHPTQGRGFHLNGNNLSVHDNTINVIEKSTNQEYGAPIASINRVGGVASVVLASAVAQSVGNTVIISGTAGLDGTFVIASVVNSTTFTYNNPGPDISLGAGGNATGCELNGAYGIQVESDLFPSGNITVFNNNVIASANECPATALKMTNISSTSKLNIHDNSFTARRIGSTTKSAHGSAVEIFDGTSSTLDHNTFVTDTTAMHIDYLGGSNLKYTNTTFAKGSNPAASWFLTDFGNTFGGGASINNVFLDSTYQNGASDQYTSIAKSNTAEEFFINWTVILKVVDHAHGDVAVPNANVNINDVTGKSVFTGTTAADGTVSSVLTERHASNSSTQSIVPPDPLTPHTVTVTAACTPNPATFSVSVSSANLPPPGSPIVLTLASCP